MPTTRTTARIPVLAACAAATVLVGTSGCGVADLLTEEKTQHYDAVADAPTRGDLAFQLPDVVPDDATDITVRIRTDETGLKAYDWLSAGGQLPPDCEPSEPVPEVDPFYTSGGWPDAATEAAGQWCDPQFVTRVDGRYYAWQTP